jgi:hypothetical protein
MQYVLLDVTMAPDTIQLQSPEKVAHGEGDISFMKSFH